MTVYYDTITTTWGDMFLATTEKGICCAMFIESAYSFDDSNARKFIKADEFKKDSSKLVHAKQQLLEYFDGTRDTFDLALDLSGTDFQMAVWDILLEIPFGEVWSYQDVAIKAGDANKVRAVGGAVGKNPVVLIVPCHRVVGKSGKLTGFSSLGGVALKQKILDHEGISLNSGTDYQIPLI